MINIKNIRRQFSADSITDDEFFSSDAFLNYLETTANMLTKRYGKGIKVKISNKIKAPACTNNDEIIINIESKMVASCCDREEKFIVIKGLLFHEIGHCLFNDFDKDNTCVENMEKGQWYPAAPIPVTDLEIRAAEEISQNMAVLSGLIKLRFALANIADDIWLENRLSVMYPGTVKRSLRFVSEKLKHDMPSIEEQIEKNSVIGIIFNAVLCYGRYFTSTEFPEDYNDFDVTILDRLFELMDLLRYENNIDKRHSLYNLMLLNVWDLVKDVIDKLKIKCNSGIRPKGTGNALVDESEGIVPKPKNVKAANISTDESGEVNSNGTDDGGGTDSGGTGDDLLVELEIASLCKAINNQKAAEIAEQMQAKDLKSQTNIKDSKEIRITRTLDYNIEIYYELADNEVISTAKKLALKYKHELDFMSQGGKLTRLPVGRRMVAKDTYHNDGKIFSKNKVLTEPPRIAIGVLKDQSGSMFGENIKGAVKAALAIEEFCGNTEIPLMVAGHSTTLTGITCIRVYSCFERFTNKDKFRIATASQSANGGNRDHAAIEFIAGELLKRDEEIKLLIVINDGEPSAYDWNEDGVEMTAKTVKHFKNKGVAIYAAAIGDNRDKIKAIYGDGYMDISNLSELPKRLINKIKKIAEI